MFRVARLVRSGRMSALLSVRALEKRFTTRSRGLFRRTTHTVQAVADVSFELERGSALGLVGESGSGKSTTARMIAGLLAPTSGSIRLDGVELAGAAEAVWRPQRRRLQMIFQDPYASLDPRRTVGATVIEPMIVQRLGKPRERRVRALALLEAVGLSAAHAGRYPHEFSGGQRQRVGIARALALEPELLVCDEPVSALDVSVQAQIINLFKELQERFGLAYLFIAHDLAVVRSLCERIAVMYAGRIVELAPRDSLFDSPRHPYTRALLSAVPIADPVLARTRERIVLLGDPPSLHAPPSGCPFHPRCSERVRVKGDRCARERPELPHESHSAACHLSVK
ncbi:MAG: ATP-binding cassette domain-containing protein [Planctomycetes bacterium]|nr:ATP-binding cassette domain-containing protein [Planctomycetota bacterium]